MIICGKLYMLIFFTNEGVCGYPIFPLDYKLFEYQAIITDFYYSESLPQFCI